MSGTVLAACSSDLEADGQTFLSADGFGLGQTSRSAALTCIRGTVLRGRTQSGIQAGQIGPDPAV